MAAPLPPLYKSKILKSRFHVFGIKIYYKFAGYLSKLKELVDECRWQTARKYPLEGCSKSRKISARFFAKQHGECGIAARGTARAFGGGLRRSTVAHFARKVRGTNIMAAKHELKIQQGYAPERWSCSLRVRGPHFASKVSYNAGASLPAVHSPRKGMPPSVGHEEEKRKYKPLISTTLCLK